MKLEVWWEWRSDRRPDGKTKALSNCTPKGRPCSRFQNRNVVCEQDLEDVIHKLRIEARSRASRAAHSIIHLRLRHTGAAL